MVAFPKPMSIQTPVMAAVAGDTVVEIYYYAISVLQRLVGQNETNSNKTRILQSDLMKSQLKISLR